MSSDPLIGPVAPPGLHVMTFNVRRRSDSAVARRVDRWAHRRSFVAALLASERPTLLGVQEARPDQASTIVEALGSAYRFVGRGHGPQGRGEGCPLFFDAERLELLDWKQTALSDEPELPGSTSWGNRIPRIIVTATFRDTATSVQFVASNTHLDHLSARSRVRSAEEIRGGLSDAPTILTGDFNDRVGSPTYRTLYDDARMADAWITASVRVTPEWSTFGGYRAPRVGGRRIDWIAVSPDIGVERSAINARTIDGGWPSDHLPVQAVLRLPEYTT